MKRDNEYIINENFMYMTGEYDQNGNLYTRVYETDTNFLVPQSPVKIIDGTLKYISYDFKGAIGGSKFLLGNRYMRPVLICPFQKICIFPHKSFTHHDCIWFNEKQIKYTGRRGNKTEILFFNGTTLTIGSKITSFNSKLQTAEQLIKMTKRIDS